ncbi:MAG TPA: ATP-binding protein [Candidatus Thermoplasmatota archaeon]
MIRSRSPRPRTPAARGRPGDGLAAHSRAMRRVGPAPSPRHSATRGARRGPAGRRGHSALAVRTDQQLKTLTPAHLPQSHEAERRTLATVDRLLLDDVGLEAMDAQESRDAYELLLERHRTGSMVVTSARGPDEWLATFADPGRAQRAIDRFTHSADDLVIDGESYRARLKPTMKPAAPAQQGTGPHG